MQRNNKKGEHLNVTIGKKTNNTTNVYEFRYHKPKTLQNIQLKEKKNTISTTSNNGQKLHFRSNTFKYFNK